jgi:hypothetical protein
MPWKKFPTFYSYSLHLVGDYFVVFFGSVVTGILDMRPGKHDLHFLVDDESLTHAFVNIPDEKMHIGVILLFILYLFILYILNNIHIYLFTVF